MPEHGQNVGMHAFSKFLFVCAANCVAMLLLCSPLQAQQGTLQVLILNSFDESSAPYFRPTDVFKEKLQEDLEAPIAFQEVDLRLQGMETKRYVSDVKAQLLRDHYVDSPPDLVVAFGPPAIGFWVNNRGSTFPDALFIAMARSTIMEKFDLQPRDGVVATEFSFKEVAEDILQLRPETRHIVMVFGDSLYERTFSAVAKAELESWSDRITYEFTNDMAIHEIQEKVARLPSDAAVFYGIFSADINGVRMQHYSGLSMIRAVSSAPVFGPFDDQMGHGILGGRLIQATEIGKELALLAQTLLSDVSEPPGWKTIKLNTPQYDWRELQAWDISSDRLPPGSIVRFEPPGFWEKYAAWVVGVTFVILAQALLLANLLRQRRQRMKTEMAHTTLSRRLITAHEDERRILARELHDDLSQRLARVAIDASYVKSHQGSESSNKVLEDLHPELVRISKDVHHLSYRLHPSLVDDLGIVAALRSEVERAQRLNQVTITTEISEPQQKLPPETALCIYRIAQESLQNALKHAKATTIDVVLKTNEQKLKLIVRDDGVGFDVEEAKNRFSIGLSSMQERALLVNGTLDIRGRPGEGTMVTLTVPDAGARA